LSIRVLVLYRYGSSRDPHSFPTRRSSDLDRRELTFNVSALFNWGFGVVRAPDPDDHARPGDTRLDRLRYGIAANVRWKQLDVYGALIWDRLYGLPGALRRDFERTAAGLTFEIDYLLHEKVLLSTRFDQLWAGGLREEKRDGSVLSLQAKFYPWQNVALFARDSVNARSFVEESPLRNWRNQLFVGIDWDFCGDLACVTILVDTGGR